MKNSNKIILSMTIRGAFADQFWFTLFHEIGHLLNGDIINNQFIDYTDSKSDMEDKADEFARKTLIDEESYNTFTRENYNFIGWNTSEHTSKIPRTASQRIFINKFDINTGIRCFIR